MRNRNVLTTIINHVWHCLIVAILFGFSSPAAYAEKPVQTPLANIASAQKPQTFKPGTPEAAVALLLKKDFLGNFRGANEMIPVFYPHIAYQSDKSIYAGDEHMFLDCRSALVRNYRIIGGGYAPNPVGVPPDAPSLYLVTVEAEMLAVWGRPNPAPPKMKGYCGWKDLEIINRETGQVERIGDVLIDEGGNYLIPLEGKYARRLNNVIGSSMGAYFYVINPEHRLWRFRVPLVYREIMRNEFVEEHGRYRDVLRRGWMFVGPYPAPLVSVAVEADEAVKNKKSDDYKKTVQLLITA
jgi:hypothetical protein